MSKRSRYERYIQSSPVWQAKRQRVMERAGGVCEKCRTRPAAHVHHKTYARLFNERDDDLQALCHGCHMAEHPDKVEIRGGIYADRECAFCPATKAMLYLGDFDRFYICCGCGETAREARPKHVRKRTHRAYAKAKKAARQRSRKGPRPTKPRRSLRCPADGCKKRFRYEHSRRSHYRDKHGGTLPVT